MEMIKPMMSNAIGAPIRRKREAVIPSYDVVPITTGMSTPAIVRMNKKTPTISPRIPKILRYLATNEPNDGLATDYSLQFH
ncbi:hypothetical protein D3C80_1872570 [compost metagenome]